MEDIVGGILFGLLIGTVVFLGIQSCLHGDALPPGAVVEVTFPDGHVQQLVDPGWMNYQPPYSQGIAFGTKDERRVYALEDISEYRVILKKQKTEGEQ